MDQGNKSNVTLEEALAIAGTGLYTHVVVIIAGIVAFVAFCGIELMSVVIPAASCDLELTTYQKGALTSMVYAGMICSTHMTGFLADTLGRRKVMLICCIGCTIMHIISSLAPNASFLMMYSFINGLMLSGIFTPVYVFVGEFCQKSSRTKALFITCSLGAFATCYLPGIAWLILPMKFRIDLLGSGLIFTPWRLFVALQALLFLTSTILIYFMPETPKFLLSIGKHKETMDVLKHIYSLNKRTDKKLFPVMNVVLDSSDEMEATEAKGGIAWIRFVRTLWNQTTYLFRLEFIKYTLMSCLLSVGTVGTFTTILLWFPEVVSRLVFYTNTHPSQNATLCDVMSTEIQLDDANEACDLKDEVFIINVVNGLLQGSLFVIISFIAPYFRKRHLLIFFCFVSMVANFVILFTDIVLLVVFCLGAILLLLFSMFPLTMNLVVDFFPTGLRGTATSLVMLAGRSSVVVGSQLAGALYPTQCQEWYITVTVVLAAMTAVCVVMPTKRKELEKQPSTGDKKDASSHQTNGERPIRV